MIHNWYLDAWGEQKDIIIIFFLILFVNHNVKQINTNTLNMTQMFSTVVPQKVWAAFAVTKDKSS